MVPHSAYCEKWSGREVLIIEAIKTFLIDVCNKEIYKSFSLALFDICPQGTNTKLWRFDA